VGVDTAMQLLRPGAKWEISNTMFTRWEDPRPCPTWEEVMETVDKIKKFEDSINTIWLEEDVKNLKKQNEVIERALS
jgi:tRNA uridine 5-carbamoylmethylation protein Kti12